MEGNRILFWLGRIEFLKCFGVFVLCIGVNGYAHAQHSHSTHPKTEKVDTYYEDGELFEAKRTFLLTFKTQAQEKKEPSVDSQNSHRIEKSVEEKDALYLKLAEMMPAGIRFRINSASDIAERNSEVILDFQEDMDTEALSALEGVTSVREIFKGGTFGPGEKQRIPGHLKSLPEGWNKETGYRKIGDLFDDGENLVLVSVVFYNPENDRTFWPFTSHAPFIQPLVDNQKGLSLGMSYDDQERAWWTQEMSINQINTLFENKKVINLIPRHR